MWVALAMCASPWLTQDAPWRRGCPFPFGATWCVSTSALEVSLDQPNALCAPLAIVAALLFFWIALMWWPFALLYDLITLLPQLLWLRPRWFREQRRKRLKKVMLEAIQRSNRSPRATLRVALSRPCLNRKVP